MSFHRGDIAWCAAVVLALTVRLAPAAAPQSRGYMKITLANGQVVSGEALDPAHTGWIEFTQVVTRPSGQVARELQKQPSAISSSPGKLSSAQRQSAGAANGTHFNEMAVTKKTDKASPFLMQAAANGTHFKEVLLELVRTNPSGQEYAYQRFKLTEVIVSSIRSGGSGGDQSTESLSLSYAKLTTEPVAPSPASAPMKALKPSH